MNELTHNLVILAATAALSGLLVPYVIKRIDTRRHETQKILEAQLARQSRLIDAQSELLEELANSLWTFQFRAIAVTYYHGVHLEELYTDAVSQYDSSTIDNLVRIRTAISKSIYLCSTSVYEKLKVLYFERLLPLDQNLRGV